MEGITETNLAWLAGIADGEGSFYLTATYDTTGRPVVKYSFAVGNTSLELLLEVRRILTGLIGHALKLNPIKGRGNRKKSWNIQVTSLEDLKIVCNAMLPYLIAKPAQAELMIEFCNLGLCYGNRFTRRNVAMFQKRLSYVARMKALNRYRTGAIENKAESQQEAKLPAPRIAAEEMVRTSRRREERASTLRLLPFEKVN